MAEQLLTHRSASAAFPSKILNIAAVAWFVVTAAGQWLFGIYILLFYGNTTISGHWEQWNKVLPHGYVAGDWKGNLLVASHVLWAAVPVIAGPLQLIPALRAGFPVFHRWLGRIYLVTAVTVAIGGFAMVWTRGAVGDIVQHVSISIQAVYIVLFALFTVRYARGRQFERHRKWALRLFMVVSGVWFFRVGLMCWLILNGGPVGFDRHTFTGPFLWALAVFTYAVPLPLMVLELYFHALKQDKGAVKSGVALLILSATVLVAIGIFGAVAGMWLPRIR